MKNAKNRSTDGQMDGQTNGPTKKSLLRDYVKGFSFGVEDKMRTSDANDAHRGNEDADGLGKIEATTM